MTKDEILKELPYLERADLEAVHTMAGHLLGGAVAADGKAASPIALMAFEALTGALGYRGHYANLPATSKQQFENKIPTLTAFLNENFNFLDRDKIEQTAILQFLFDLLIVDLKLRGVPITFGIVITNLNRMSEVFDNAFPGYLAAGLATMVFKKFK